MALEPAEEEYPVLPERSSPGCVLALVGPTAAGKTHLAMQVAARLDLEIVGVDSMQIYRGMDVGTAKPAAVQMRRVRHHMIDVADPAEPWSVARFQAACRAAIRDVLGRGGTPLLVGGSGLYFRSVVDDLEFPPTDAAVRRRLEGEEPSILAERLRRVDPAAAALIDPSNTRRVVRALEVLELTGSPFSSFRSEWERYRSRYDLVVAGLKLPGAELARRIEARTRAMFEGGLVDEVRDLLARGLGEALKAKRAIAYREAVAFVEGTLEFEEAIVASAAATRRFARRQMIWFRRDPRIRWFDATGDSAGLAADLERFFGAELERRG